ncbi:hypothetical protein GEMRC1_010262 [Eukaryota sp. GEM-RC1]
MNDLNVSIDENSSEIEVMSEDSASPVTSPRESPFTLKKCSNTGFSSTSLNLKMAAYSLMIAVANFTIRLTLKLLVMVPYLPKLRYLHHLLVSLESSDQVNSSITPEEADLLLPAVNSSLVTVPRRRAPSASDSSELRGRVSSTDGDYC